MSVLEISVQKLAGESPAVVKPSKFFMFPHPLAWIFVGFILALDLFFLVTNDFTIKAGSVWPILTLAVAGLFLGLGVQRQKPTLAMLAFTIAFFVIAGKSIRALNYLTTSLANPFITPDLDAIDRWLGFDWLQYLSWVNESPLLLKIFPVAYDALSVSTVFTVFALIALRQHEKLREFLILFFGLAFVVTTIGWLFPVQDTFSFYNPPFDMRPNIRDSAGVFHLPHFIPLRNGTMTDIDLSRMVGMVQFPSFHTIAGLLIIWANRGSLLFIVMAVVNLIMIAAAVVYGGHYLIDIIVSITMTAVAIGVYQAFRSSGWARHHWKRRVAAGILN